MIKDVVRTRTEPLISSAEWPNATGVRVRDSISLDAIAARDRGRFSMLARHWRTIRKSDALTPDRSDFDPTAIRRLLPNIHLMEFIDDDHLIYRLSGHEEVRRLGNELKGANYFDRINRDAEPLVRRTFPRLFQHSCGVIVSTDETYDDGSVLKADYLGLPLAQADAPARFVISVIEANDDATVAPLSLTDRPVLLRHRTLAIRPVDIGGGAPDLKD
ncbi:MAG: PAS domain-containing protein [Alphaproteobacteria bacterium]|nr:PAS domain-containing protein [Alphaproteobacteria bacterium]